MKNPFDKQDIKIAVIGGGTGSFTVLSALKDHTKQLAALVNMVDDGGSTGVLRDELGVLPPGDVRQCLVALSSSPQIRDLFSYRFEEGTFKGHAFGNLLLTALEKITGNFSEAVETASEILRVRGVVIPVTLDNVHLKMEWPEVSVVLNGERTIADEFFKHNPRRATLSLTPKAKPNPLALKAIHQADLVIIAPGDLYASLGPTLVINQIGKALKSTKALKIYVANLVTKQGQTEGFTVSDHVAEIERFVGSPFLDYVIYNHQQPDPSVRKRYKAEKAFPVKVDKTALSRAHYKAIGENFLGPMASRNKADVLLVNRSLIRHETSALAKIIMEIYQDERRR